MVCYIYTIYTRLYIVGSHKRKCGRDIVTQTNKKSKLVCSKKYHNHTLGTNSQHCEEEP